jgi:hypothetical protein
MVTFRPAILVSIALLVVSCATQRPVLYPNAHLQAVGDERAQQDIDRCIQRAKTNGADASKAGEVARHTGVGAAGGAATGAVVGAITGSAGRSAAVGAAGGGTVGLFSSVWRTREPDPVFQRYIEQCLHDKGYHTIGWR